MANIDFDDKFQGFLLECKGDHLTIGRRPEPQAHIDGPRQSQAPHIGLVLDHIIVVLFEKVSRMHGRQLQQVVGEQPHSIEVERSLWLSFRFDILSAFLFSTCGLLLNSSLLL